MAHSALFARILAQCVAEEPWPAPPPGLSRLVAGQDLTGLTEAAEYHHVTGYVRQRLRQLPNVDPRGLAALEERHRRRVLMRFRALADLAHLHRAFAATGMPWLVIKGPVLAETVYREPDLRAYGDLDVVVPRDAFRDALAELERIGCRTLDQNWGRLREEMRGQVHLLLPAGTPAELHWHLINRASVREGFTISMEEIFSRPRSVTLNGVTMSTLDHTDTLAYLALHCALHGWKRLIWLKDIERVTAAEPPNWEAVVDRANAWGAAGLLSTALRRARAAVSAAVPWEVVQALAPPQTLRTMITIADYLSPAERHHGPGPSPAKLLTRAIRRGLPSSMRALMDLLVMRAQRLLRGQKREISAQPDHPPAQIGTRTAFLDAVASYEDEGQS